MNADKLTRKIAEKNISRKFLAEELEIDVSTFYRKLQRPDSFSVEQAAKLARILELTKDETNDIFFNL